MYYSTKYQSPIGNLLLASDGVNIIGLWMEGQKYYGGTIKKEMVMKDDLAVFNIARKWLDKYFEGHCPAISELPLAPIGSSFRLEVWRILTEIPYGQTITYGQIAQEVALKMNKNSMSAQAVGGAVGHNPISIIIPCHRVVGTDRSLTGYAGGIEVKIKLLELEGVDVSSLLIPKSGTAL